MSPCACASARELTPTQEDSEAEEKLVFSLMDADGDGSITATDLSWVCTQLGIPERGEALL